MAMGTRATCLEREEGSWKRLIILFIILLITHLLCSLLLYYIDGTESRRKLDEYESRCKEYFESIFNNYTSNVELITFNATVVYSTFEKLHNCHLHTKPPLSQLPTDSFDNSFNLMFSIYTTIGYGNVSPTTTGGQIFCVIYGFFAFPLFFVFLNECKRILIHYLNDVAEEFIQSMQKNITDTTLPNFEWKRKVTVYFATFLLVFSFLIICSLIMRVFSNDDWSAWENFYFLYQSMALIGFGDYFISDHTRWIFLMPSILLGIVLLSLCQDRFQTVWVVLADAIIDLITYLKHWCSRK